MTGMGDEWRPWRERVGKRWRWLVLPLAALLWLASFPLPARAAIMLSAPAIIAAPGSTGSFDVSLSNTDPVGGDSFDVAAFNYTLSLGATPGVEFTGVDTSSTNYIFPPGTNLGDPLSFDVFPNTSFTAFDIVIDPFTDFVRINPGQTFTLGRVFFDVSAAASPGAVFMLSLSDFEVSDPDGSPFMVAADNGSITIAQQAVPEPSTLSIFGLLGAALLVGIRRRRGLPGAA